MTIKYKIGNHLKKIIIILLTITAVFNVITMYLIKDMTIIGCPLWMLQAMFLCGIPFFVFGVWGYWHSLGRYIDWDRRHGRYAMRETRALEIEEQGHQFVMGGNVFFFGFGVFLAILPPFAIITTTSIGIYIMIPNYILMILLVIFFAMFFRKRKR